MKIWAYCITNSDETDCLQNALSSVARIPVDRIVLCDGGTSSPMIQKQRNTVGVEDWLDTRQEYRNGEWQGIPLVYLCREWDHPAGQRNYVLNWIDAQSDNPDWIIAIDSDEVESTEAEQGIRTYLESLPEDVTNVTQPLLSLVQDERHSAAGQHSTWLAHSRLHKTGAVSYVGEWHEHQNYTGKRVQWNARIIHERMLFRRRIYLQRGAATLKGAWRDVEMIDVPSDVHWAPLEWDKNERVVPFDNDIRPLLDENGDWK